MSTTKYRTSGYTDVGVALSTPHQSPKPTSQTVPASPMNAYITTTSPDDAHTKQISAVQTRITV